MLKPSSGQGSIRSPWCWNLFCRYISGSKEGAVAYPRSDILPLRSVVHHSISRWDLLVYSKEEILHNKNMPLVTFFWGCVRLTTILILFVLFPYSLTDSITHKNEFIKNCSFIFKVFCNWVTGCKVHFTGCKVQATIFSKQNRYSLSLFERNTFHYCVSVDTSNVHDHPLEHQHVLLAVLQSVLKALTVFSH